MENKVGRPTLYSQELADTICAKIAEGYSVRTICVEENMPALTTFFRWIKEKPEFRQQYAYATEERTEAMAEDILDIADDGVNDYMWVQYGKDPENGAWKENKEVTNRSRLRVDTRKWIMSKMKPKKYGDKIDMTTNGKDLPAPLLSAIDSNVRDNNSNEENRSA